MQPQDFVILAAGIGSRLHPLTDETPKGLVPVAQKPIIFHTLDVLAEKIQADPVRVSIVVGHMAHKMIEAVSSRYPFVNFIFNNDYLKTNNAFSLYLHLATRDERKALTFMNGDCIYGREIVNLSLSSSETTIFYDPDQSYNEESMKISGLPNKVDGIAKDIPANKALGISCDIYHFAPHDAARLRHTCFGAVQRGSLTIWSEAVLNGALVDGSIAARAASVNGCPWYEIDNHHDLESANKLFSGKMP